MGYYGQIFGMRRHGENGLDKNKMYLIKWRDHYFTTGFFDLDDPEIVDEVVLTSVGFFIKEDKHYYHFAQTVGEDICAEIMSIIREQVITIREVTS